MKKVIIEFPFFDDTAFFTSYVELVEIELALVLMLRSDQNAEI